MDGDTGYQPIACDFHDDLEAYAVTRRRVRISHVSEAPSASEASSASEAEAPSRTGNPEASLPDLRNEGLILDIYTTDRKEEYLRLDDGTAIRLDRIKSIETLG
jgi:transcriptional antiterminator Rof (Rho-off)